jgi:hypothetical protein
MGPFDDFVGDGDEEELKRRVMVSIFGRETPYEDGDDDGLAGDREPRRPLPDDGRESMAAEHTGDDSSPL